MNTTALTLVALVFSSAGFRYLAYTNAKRRRAHKLPKYSKPVRQVPAWIWVLLPLPVLVIIGNMPALIMWATALSLLGWGMAVKKPV